MKRKSLIIIGIAIIIIFLFVFAPIIITESDTMGVNAKTEIKDAMLSCGLGPCVTKLFPLNKNDSLSSTQFTDLGYDQHSIIFDVEKDLTSKFEIKTDETQSDIKYVDNKPSSAKARLICEKNGEDLEEQLTTLKIIPTTNPTILCGINEYQPCCLILIKEG